MALSISLLLALWCTIFSLVQGHTIQIRRRELSEVFQWKRSVPYPNTEGKNLYWFANYTVGARSNVELVIDTGSTDVLLNPGYYNASKTARPYKNSTFQAVYEGVNKAGKGSEVVNGKIVEDIVSAGGLSLQHQPLGSIENFTIYGARPLKKAVRFDGIMGFDVESVSAFVPPARSWFNNLCKSGSISECRFGLAFGTNNKGTQVIGELDKSLYKGDLYQAPLHNQVFPLWVSKADIVVNGAMFLKNQTVIMDTGTTNIQAPPKAALKLFNLLGWNYKKTKPSKNTTIAGKRLYFYFASFPCDKPPTLGFSFPAEADIKDPSSPAYGKKAKVFDIAPKDWVLKNKDNSNCTSVVAGTNEFSFPKYDLEAWLVGQPLYQGRYVDHHHGVGLGFADLVDPENVQKS